MTLPVNVARLLTNPVQQNTGAGAVAPGAAGNLSPSAIANMWMALFTMQGGWSGFAGGMSAQAQVQQFLQGGAQMGDPQMMILAGWASGASSLEGIASRQLFGPGNLTDAVGGF
ncbi:MAG: hypothetical protein HY319_15265 [Armatimonadetes bacterium]|nr:hypothetical protein [Armatimonadota bacterium]